MINQTNWFLNMNKIANKFLKDKVNKKMHQKNVKNRKRMNYFSSRLTISKIEINTSIFTTEKVEKATVC